MRGAYGRAAADLRDFLDEQPECAHAWQALAWSQYCSHHYDEALASINTSLKLRDDPQTLSIRACILAEKGIKEESRAAVVEARGLFERLLESLPPSWQIYYNLGNVLSALGEHQEAIQYYQKALDLEPHDPTIWKNIASSYHHAGDHHEELRCFDRALELNPVMPEALASKGISLLIDLEKPEEAASLLERALQYDPDSAVQWPHIWYWLALAYLKSGSLTTALQYVEEGLAHQPGHLALKGLMSVTLESLLAQGIDVKQKARNFWKAQLVEEPLEYSARSLLANLEIQEGNELVAWSLLEESFDLMQILPVVPLRTSRFSIKKCINALELLPQYAAFRRDFPVSAYWDQENPLHDVSFPPPFSDSILGALTTFLSIPFGLGIICLEDGSTSPDSKETLLGMMDVLRRHVEHSFVEAAGNWHA